MSYSNLKEALKDLETDQVVIVLDTTGDEDHKVTLHLCPDGLKYVLEQAEEHMNLDGSALSELCPQLKDIDLTDLVLKAITNGSVEIEDLLESIEEATEEGTDNAVAVLKNPQVGDKVTATREVTSVYGYGIDRTVQFRDDHGKYSTVKLKSWQGYGNKRKVSRK